MKDLEGDKLHVLVLFFLYILQVKPNNKQENSPFVFYYCRASLLAWSTLCHLCLGRRRWKKAPAPKLWPYHKYHQYHDIKGDHHTNVNISITCTTIVKGVLRRASKVLHLLLPVLHEIALGSPGWLDLCCKVLQLSDIQNWNMPIALL